MTKSVKSSHYLLRNRNILMQEALISIKPQYVHRFLSGEKTVEIRRRRINLKAGTKLWIYSTMPEGIVSSVGEIKSIEVSNREEIWKKYSSQMGITYDEFCSYVNGAEEISAISISNLKRVSPAPTLKCLREKIGKFNPPQFFIRLDNNNKLREALNATRLAECY